MTDEKKYPIHFAPLHGYTDAAYRNAHEIVFGGVETYYTPFVRLERGDNFRTRELRDIESENNKVSHLIPQLIANTPEEFRKVANLFVAKGHTEADINMGCPFPMLARKHKGSGILPYADEVANMLATTSEFPNLKFSVKMRLGWDNPEECLALLPILNDLPLRQVSLHARLGKQQYKGETDLDAFQSFYDGCKHPLFYNGDLCSSEDIHSITTRFPNLSGLLIGRGLLTNPALVSEYKEGKVLSSKEMADKLQQIHTILLEHYESHLQGNAQLLCKMKTFWEYLLPKMEKKTRKQIDKSNKLETYKSAVHVALRELADNSEE